MNYEKSLAVIQEELEQLILATEREHKTLPRFNSRRDYLELEIRKLYALDVILGQMDLENAK